MTTIAVKPAPTLARAAWPLIVHPTSGGLLDASGAVPADGRPWLNDGFTARMLTDGAILRGDDPVFAALAAQAKADAAAAAEKVAATLAPAEEPPAPAVAPSSAVETPASSPEAVPVAQPAESAPADATTETVAAH